MKKLSFILLAAASVSFLAACGSDSGDCSFVGDWKVKSADLTSEKFSKTLLEMTKEIALSTKYNFTADSVSVITVDNGTFKGKYTVDGLTAQTLSIDATNPNPTSSSVYTDKLQIVNCSSNEITLIQRTPADTTQAALVTTKLVLERVD